MHLVHTWVLIETNKPVASSDQINAHFKDVTKNGAKPWQLISMSAGNHPGLHNDLIHFVWQWVPKGSSPLNP